MEEALYFEKTDDKALKCTLCPNFCIIKEGKNGTCRVRKNIGGMLYSEVYGKVCSLNIDPIEKKPLYHFFPGSQIISIGTVGCNFHCRFCQNWEISQSAVADYLKDYSVEEIVDVALKYPENIGISYTYNEPTVWYEYMLDIAKHATHNGLKNVMVTNGYINPLPLEELIDFMDAFSVDLKGFTEDFYKNISSGKLEPIKENLKFIQKKDKHFEIVNLVVPTLNDDEKKFEEMVKWISYELGKNVILHISRYFPRYKMTIEATPITTLEKFFEIAKKHLSYVYLGNVMTADRENTFCNNCGKAVIKRFGYSVNKTGIDNNGNCKYCRSKVENLVI